MPLLLITVPRYGFVAAAVVWAVLNLGYTIFMVALMHRRLLIGEQWRWYGKVVLLPLLAAVAVVGGSWLALHEIIRDWGRPGLIAVLAVMLAAVMSAAAVTDIGGLLLQRVRLWTGAAGRGARQ